MNTITLTTETGESVKVRVSDIVDWTPWKSISGLYSVHVWTGSDEPVRTYYTFEEDPR